VDHHPGYHGIAMGTVAVRFLVVWMAGWVNSRQLEVIDFLREENRVLREQLGGRRHGLEPAPARGKRTPWKTFLRTHLGRHQRRVWQ
jgi:hypothetical protein